MALRTDPTRVRNVIQTLPDLDPSFAIDVANALTNYVASKDTAGVLTTELLLEIETYLAAHFYALRDQAYRSKSTGAASATFQGVSGKRLEATDWGQQAIALDITGTLEKVNAGAKNKASAYWLGQPVSQQVDYWDRN